MAEPTSSRARSEVASALGRVTDDLTLLEALLAVLRHHDGSDQAVIEAAVAVKMASGAIAPTAKAWQAEPDPAMVDVAGRTGRLLRSRLADGDAHLATQAGQPRPCVAGQPPEAQGLHPAGPDTWTGAGAALYWLADRGRLGALALPAAELTALLRTDHAELAGRSERRLLAALLGAGAIVPSATGRPTHQVKVAGRGRRLALVPVEVIFPTPTPTPADPVTRQSGIPDNPDSAAAPSGVDLSVPPRTEVATPGGGEGVSDGEWESILDRLDGLSDAAVTEVMARLEAAGHTLGPTLPAEVVASLTGWLTTAEQLATAEPRPEAAGPVATRPAPARGPSRLANKARGLLPGPAVLAADRLILPGGRTVPVASPLDVDALAAMALSGGARGVMVHPSAPDPTGLPEPPEDRPLQSLRSGGRSVTIVLLGHDVQRHCGPWADADSAEGLVEGLERFRRAVGHPWRSSVGRTGEALIRWTHPAERGGTQLGSTPDLPEPARDGALEVAFMWHRALTGVERSAGWVHLFDLNGQYLAAWESVELGLGPAEYHPGPINVEGWVKARPSGARLVAPPGLWHLELPADPVDQSLPNAWGNGAGVTRWVTTPTLARALEVHGSLPPISEAWWWPEQSRYLRAPAERLRDARMALIDDPAPAAQLALAAVKDLYRRGTGRLAMADRNPNSGWPRPDWRLAIIAQARVNLHRTLTAKLAAPPFAALVDGLCFASNEADPLAFAAAIGLPVGSRLGQWSHEGTAALPPLVDQLDGAASAAAVVKILKGAMRGPG
jgi:hypothetical protein